MLKCAGDICLTHFRIDNPLARLSLAQLDRKAAQFAVKVDPHAPDKRLWKTAARVARKQRNVSALRELTDRERAALEAENKAGFWEQPKALRITIVVLSLAAATQGWVQTGLNGANQKWLRALLDLSSNQALTANQTWIFSGVNAIMYFSASLFGCWVSDPLQSLILGRRGAMILSAGLCIAGAIGSACSNTWTQLLGCRIVLGAAMGSKAAVTPVFGAEVSPKHIRSVTALKA